MMPEGRTRRPQVERRAETERRVLDAAMQLIAERGSHAVTLAEVGKAAGYSRGIVHHHFGNRERLLSAVIADAQGFPTPDYDGDALEQLCRIIEAYLRNVTDRAPSARAFLQLWGEAVAADPALTPMFAERDADLRSFLSGRVRAGIEDGTIRSDIDPAAAAVVLLALLRGIGLQLISTPPPDDFPTIVSTAQSIARGAFAPGPDRRSA